MYLKILIETIKDIIAIGSSIIRASNIDLILACPGLDVKTSNQASINTITESARELKLTQTDFLIIKIRLRPNKTISKISKPIHARSQLWDI
jgi:hypothetical protein